MAVAYQSLFDQHAEVSADGLAEQLPRIPAGRGVALLAAADGSPICMLTAADLRARVSNRLRDPSPQERSKIPDLLAVTAAVHWRRCWSHFETDALFLHAASQLWPREYPDLLAVKPAWFVHAKMTADYPYFLRTREVLAEEGEYLGPFPNARSSEQFIHELQDLFDLCRDPSCLRSAPNAPRCAYGQMNRCLCPCDGTISAEAYRAAVVEADAFARGEREGVLAGLNQEMRDAAARQAYEQAARIKSRLQRAEQFDRPDWSQVCPARRFQFLIFQPGTARQLAAAFWADRGVLTGPRPIRWPAQPAELESLLAEVAESSARPQEIGRLERHRIALVSHYLFAGPQRRGLMLRWSRDLSAGHVAEALDAAQEILRLRPPRKAKGQTPDRPKT